MASFKVISGGQNGADQAALFAAEHFKFSTGGTIPHAYYTLDGPAPWLSAYGLVPLQSNASISIQYVIRSRKNVDDSDGTLAFRTHPSSGTDKTIGYALTRSWYVPRSFDIETSYRPVCVVADVNSETEQARVVQFIKDNNIKILNVCGHREPDAIAKSWTRSVEHFLMGVFSQL